MELRNLSTNAYEYLGAVNFNNSSNNYPGQIGYIAYNPTNQNYDYFEFRVGGNVGLVLQADPRGLTAGSLVGGYPGNQVSAIGCGGDVIAGGGYGPGPNLVLSNTSGVFIGAGSANQIGPNFNDSAIVGGYGNIVQSPDAFIGGGAYNTIPTNSQFSFIGGGENNSNAASLSALVGGYQSMIQPGANYSFIGGGQMNSIQTNSLFSFIGCGYNNTVLTNSSYSAIVNGSGNSIQGAGGYSFIGGGLANSLLTYVYNGFIGGGYGNIIRTNANYSTIGGGYGNAIQSYVTAGSIGGGYSNSVSGAYGTVPGGFLNVAGGTFSFAAGHQAQALHQGSFVWADSQSAIFASTANNQFSVRAIGGVNFQTAGAGLTVDGQPVLSGSGSANYIQNQTASPQSASFNINGNAQIAGLIRSGSETGTTEAPSPVGLVARRINSISMTVGNVLARTDTLTLERDGTHGGMLIRYGASPGTVTIACMGMDSTGAQKNFYTTLANPSSSGTVQIYTDSQNIVHFECTFGVTYSAGQHLTQVTLSRYGTDFYWSGNVISTYNQ